MKPFRKILFVLTTIIACSCTKQFLYQPHSDGSPNMDIVYRDGKPINISYLPNSSALIIGERTDNSTLVLKVGLMNQDSIQRINLFPTQIRVFGLDRDYELHSHLVWEPDDYLKKMKTQQAIAMGLLAFNAGYQAQQAGYSTTTTQTSVYGSASSSDGTYVHGSAYGNSTSTTYDASKVAEANYRNQQQLNGLAANMNRSYEATEQGILKRVTLFPGEYVEGNIMVKLTPAYADVLRIEIPVNDYVHTFFLHED